MLSRAERARCGGLGRLAAAFALGAGLPWFTAAAVAADADSIALAYAWWRTPPGVASADVARGLRVDGVPFEVRDLRSALPPAVLALRWRQWWAAQSIMALESRAAEWHVLSYRRGAALVSVQLRPAADGGTEGYVALGSPSSYAPALARDELPLRLPAGARQLRTVESHDGARVATQTVIATSATARHIFDALARGARLAGWSPGPALKSTDRRAAAHAEHAHGLWFVRGGDELAIFVHAQPAGALALIHHVRARPGPREER